MGAPDEAGAVNDVDGDEADAVYASRVYRIVLDAEFLADAWSANVSDPPVGLDGGERKPGYLHGFHSGRSEERTLTDVRLANNSD